MIPLPTRRNARALALLALIAPARPAPAQVTTFRQPEPDNPVVQVKYGSIVTSSFDKGNQFHRYVLEVRNAGDRVRITVKPTGETLRTSVGLFDAADNLIDSSPRLVNGGRGQTGNRSRFALRSSRGLASPELLTKALSSSGAYHIEVFNGEGGVGRYQLLVEGTLANNQVIGPGNKDAAGADAADAGSPAAAVGGEPAAPEVGFPGLRPVDFSSAVTNDMPADGAIRGKIASAQDRIVRAYTYTPDRDGACEVTFRRAKGSAALGFVILSAANEVLAQSSLVASDQVTTTLVFPEGPATLGVFRLDSMRGRAQWPTEFELRVKHVPSGGGR